MSLYSTRALSNMSEVSKAKELVCDIFKVPFDSKTYQWEKYPEFLPRDVFAIFDRETIIGVTRICPQRIFLNGCIIKSAGISSVCILPEYRGRGLSRMLMEKTHEYCQIRGFDSAHLIARRAVDSYYNKFGYFGASSYPKITILNCKGRGESDKVVTFESNSSSIDELHQFYEKGFQDNYSYFKRTSQMFEYSLQRLLMSNEVQLDRIIINGKLSGYMIYKDNLIFEISCNLSLDLECILLNLFKRFGEFSINQNINSALSELVSHIELDYKIELRSCYYGGHMFLPLKDCLIEKVKDFQSNNINKTFQIPLMDQM